MGVDGEPGTWRRLVPAPWATRRCISALEKLVLLEMEFDEAGSAAVKGWVLPLSLERLDLQGCSSLTSLPELSLLVGLWLLSLELLLELLELLEHSISVPRRGGWQKKSL